MPVDPCRCDQGDELLGLRTFPLCAAPWLRENQTAWITAGGGLGVMAAPIAAAGSRPAMAVRRAVNRGRAPVRSVAARRTRPAAYRAGRLALGPGTLPRRQASEQYFTSSQFLAQVLRQLIKRPQFTQGFVGNAALFPLKPWCGPLMRCPPPTSVRTGWAIGLSTKGASAPTSTQTPAGSGIPSACATTTRASSNSARALAATWPSWRCSSASAGLRFSHSAL